jgi:hypothetical protein
MFFLLCLLCLVARSIPLEKYERYLVLQVHTLGFANRIRVIADMAGIAALTDRKLLVSWSPEMQCNIKFDDIFEKLPLNTRLLPFVLPSGGNEGSELVSRLAAEANMTFVDLHHEGFIMPRTLVCDITIDVAFTSYNGVVSLVGTPCQVYMYTRSTFLSSLVPVQKLRQSVDAVMQKYFSDVVMIGIHFRQHEEPFDWAVVPPMGSEQANLLGVGATVNHFLRIMWRLWEHFSVDGKHASTRPSIRFYLASNNDDVRQQLLM